jgi:hypothetical protein
VSSASQGRGTDDKEAYQGSPQETHREEACEVRRLEDAETVHLFNWMRQKTTVRRAWQQPPPSAAHDTEKRRSALRRVRPGRLDRGRHVGESRRLHVGEIV